MNERLRKIVSTQIPKPVLGVKERLDMRLAKFCARNGRLASLYYLVFSRRFDREHLAVLRGRLSYERSLKEMGHSSPMLRRNIHRLEKGLVMQPRRHLFAEGFILETVRCFNAAQGVPGFLTAELRWARDVLDEYFEVVAPSAIVDEARRQYALHRAPGASEHVQNDSRRWKPYPVFARPDSDITFEAVVTLFSRRRSIRWFQEQVVPEDAIQKSIEAASLAPSACNRQPFRFIVANGGAAASRIAECAGGTIGFARQIPAVIVVVGDLSAYPYERDRHLIYIDASLASMQLMLAAETLGLSTCPINWPDVDSAETRLRGMLPLPPHERVVMLIAIGYAKRDGGIPYSQKKDASSIVQFL